MKFRVWCPDIETWQDGDAIDASTASDAAHEFLNELDRDGNAFPEDNDGDGCVIFVSEWEDAGGDDNEPEHESFTFRLVKERRIDLT